MSTNKPKFDPNKPFEVVGSKPKFDPNQAYNVVDSQPEEVSKLESFGRGALQGASLGLSDEIIGALETAAKGIGGNQEDIGSWQDLITKYKQHRDESRAANKAAEEANPLTYMGGDIAGGIGSFIAGGAALKGLQGAGEAAALIPEAATATEKVLETSPIMSKMADAAKIGALAGGVSGYGKSEGQTLGEDIGETAKGALTGGLAGGSLSFLGSAASKIGKEISEQPNISKILNTAKATLSGKSLESDVITNELKAKAEDVLNSIRKEAKETGGRIGEFGKNIDIATGNQTMEKTSDLLSDIAKEQQKYGKESDGFRKLEELKNYINKVAHRSIEEVKGEFSPINLEALTPEEKATKSVFDTLTKKRAEIQAQIQQLEKDGSDKAKGTIAALKEKLHGIDSDVNMLDITPGTGTPAVTASLSQPQLVKNPITEAIEMVPGKTIAKPVAEFIPPKTQFETNIIDTLKKEALTADDTVEVEKAFNQFLRDNKDNPHYIKDFLSNMKERLLIKASGNDQNALQLLKDLNDKYSAIQNLLPEAGLGKLGNINMSAQAENTALNKIISGIKNFDTDQVAHTGEMRMQDLLENLKKINPELAEKYTPEFMDLSQRAEIAASMNKSSINKSLFGSIESLALRGTKLGAQTALGAKNIGQAIGRDIYSMTPEIMQKMASSIGGSAGKVLSNIASQPETSRRALLFTAMQRPEFRKAIETAGSMVGIGGSDGQ